MLFKHLLVLFNKQTNKQNLLSQIREINKKKIHHFNHAYEIIF